jgi:hypothetical protein
LAIVLSVLLLAIVLSVLLLAIVLSVLLLAIVLSVLLLAIVLSVLLRLTVSDYPYGILDKLILRCIFNACKSSVSAYFNQYFCYLVSNDQIVNYYLGILFIGEWWMQSSSAFLYIQVK